jgi:membrane associated rhomboid family serine protease
MSDVQSIPPGDVWALQRSFLLAAAFALLLWLIEAADLLLGLDLTPYGVYPRELHGLSGVLLAPLIHGSLSHLFANTPPLILLGTVLLYVYPRAARIVIPSVYLGSGLGVWLFARSAYHIGASGLIFGLLAFLLTIGILRWDKRAIALSLAVSFLYGGMLWGIFPTSANISFEAHFFGAIVGVILAFKLKQLDPPPPSKHYSWEDEDDEADELDDWLDDLPPENRRDSLH